MTDPDLLTLLLAQIIVPPATAPRGRPQSPQAQAMRILGRQLGSRAMRPEEGVRRVLRGDARLSPGARVVAQNLLKEMER